MVFKKMVFIVVLFVNLPLQAMLAQRLGCLQSRSVQRFQHVVAPQRIMDLKRYYSTPGIVRRNVGAELENLKEKHMQIEQELCELKKEFKKDQNKQNASIALSLISAVFIALSLKTIY